MTVSVFAVRSLSATRASQVKRAGMFGDVRAIARALGISPSEFERVIEGLDIFTADEFAALARHIGVRGVDLTDVSVSIPVPQSVPEILWALRRDIVALVPVESVAEFAAESPSPMLGHLLAVRRGEKAPSPCFVATVAAVIRDAYGYDTQALEVLRSYGGLRAA